MVPTLGRIVHFVRHTGHVAPAIITHIDGDELVLTVFAPTLTEHGILSSVEAQDRESPNEGEWFWPPRV